VRVKKARKLVRRARKAYQHLLAGEGGKVNGEGDAAGRGVGGGELPDARGKDDGVREDSRRPLLDRKIRGGEGGRGGGGGWWDLGNATQCLRFTLSDEVFCHVKSMDCCQLISQSRGALKVVKEPY
jgi:hypothetical protein